MGQFVSVSGTGGGGASTASGDLTVTWDARAGASSVPAASRYATFAAAWAVASTLGEERQKLIPLRVLTDASEAQLPMSGTYDMRWVMFDGPELTDTTTPGVFPVRGQASVTVPAGSTLKFLNFCALGSNLFFQHGGASPLCDIDEATYPAGAGGGWNFSIQIGRHVSIDALFAPIWAIDNAMVSSIDLVAGDDFRAVPTIPALQTNGAIDLALFLEGQAHVIGSSLPAPAFSGINDVYVSGGIGAVIDPSNYVGTLTGIPNVAYVAADPAGWGGDSPPTVSAALNKIVDNIGPLP